MFSNTSDLDLKLIRVFLSVVDAQGITAAESALGIRQSTISTQLSHLETRVGFRLCERGRGGFRLTPKGERFALSARTLIAATSDFIAQIRNMEKKLVGTLAIGLVGQTPLAENDRIARAISVFRKRDQAVKLSMEVAAPHELEESIINKQLDLALGYFWRRLEGITYTELFTEREVIYCGPEHPLFSSTRRVTERDLLTFDWVWRSYHVQEEQVALSHRSITANTDNIEAAAILILSGNHLGYLPEHHAGVLEQQGRLRAIERDAFGFDVPFHLAMKKSTSDKPIAKAFREDLLNAFETKKIGSTASIFTPSSP